MNKIPDKELKQMIIDRLSELPVYYPNHAKTQHTIRCDACGDSQNLSHAHLSIHIDIDDDLPMFYRCFRCNASGIVTKNKLYDWGIMIDSDMESSLNIYGKKSRKKYKSRFSDRWEDFFVPSIDNDLMVQMKLGYIESRIGIPLDSDRARQLKIVPDLYQFYQANHLKPSISKWMCNNIQNRFVGFLSTNNNRVMFRNTTQLVDDHDFRWYNLILNEGNLNPYTFYSIPNQIDMYYTHDINIHITEGIFDILSVYHNLNHENTENNFYYASCGSSALNVLEFLIDRGINTGLNVHLYADKDKSDYFHSKYLLHDTEIYQWCKSITIHRNGFEGEKDYGVRKDRIIDTQRKLYIHSQN